MHLGFTRKKIEHIASQRSDTLRAQFMLDISTFDPSMLVWVDESGLGREILFGQIVIV